MGASNSKENEETINWNNVKTDNFSPTKNMVNYNNADASKLVLNLNYPDLNISESSEFNIKYLLSNNSNFIKNNENNLNISENNENNSTSPFISSEMYNYIVNKYQNQNTNQMTGGAKNNYSDDSSTSSTSSSDLSSSSSSSSSETVEERRKRKEKKNKKHKKEEIKGGRKTKKLSPPKKNKLTETDLDYISSSAHTVSEKSISDENSVSISSSVRTSQINLISE
jgi:hypothetical protein